MDDLLTSVQAGDTNDNQAAPAADGPESSGETPAAPVFSVPPPPAEPAAAPQEPPPAEAPPMNDPATTDPEQQPAEADPPAPITPVSPPDKSAGPGEEAETKEGASLSEANKLRVCCKALKSIEREIATIIRLLDSNAPGAAGEAAALENAFAGHKNEEVAAGLKIMDGRVVEGVFDGQNMVGSDGKIYTVPANYASKSKLVEGDLLKLTITPKGSFIYKQIGPIERSRVIGSLGFDPTIGEYYATTENRRWSVIKASVTYFKGEAGDEVVLLVPKNAPSKWAAVENIIKRNPLA